MKVRQNTFLSMILLLNYSKLQNWGYTRFKVSWREWKKDWGNCPCILSTQKNNLKNPKDTSWNSNVCLVCGFW